MLRQKVQPFVKGTNRIIAGNGSDGQIHGPPIWRNTYICDGQIHGPPMKTNAILHYGYARPKNTLYHVDTMQRLIRTQKRAQESQCTLSARFDSL